MQRKLAFTFIEVIIAIVIFSIGILSVLRLVTSNLETMDKNNIRTQAVLLAKEWIELAYNLRDANVSKELSWNCLIKDDMYSRDLNALESQIWFWTNANIEDVICDDYFDVNKNLKISFDTDMHVYHRLSDKYNNFEDNYEDNKLYLYTGDVWWYDTSWYAYTGAVSDGLETFFARYLSFDKVKEWDNYLPEGKIMKITSHVLYMKMWFTWEVVFESFIWNY